MLISSAPLSSRVLNSPVIALSSASDFSFIFGSRLLMRSTSGCSFFSSRWFLLPKIVWISPMGLEECGYHDSPSQASPTEEVQPRSDGAEAPEKAPAVAEVERGLRGPNPAVVLVEDLA